MNKSAFRDYYLKKKNALQRFLVLFGEAQDRYSNT